MINAVTKSQTKTHCLEIKDLHASIGDKEILKGISLAIKSGEIHALMGANGSGKSTLLNVIMGHPKYRLTAGSISFDNQDILSLPTNKRANLGLFLAFQQPTEVPGVLLGNFLRLAKNTNLKEQDPNIKPVSPKDFIQEIKSNLDLVNLDSSFMGRSINEGFSGGEKKRSEIVQMNTLKPKIALLDEIDSGLDIDALKLIAENIQKQVAESNTGLLIITHYPRLLEYLKPHFVHILSQGRITKTGGPELIALLEEQGYQNHQS